MAENTNIRSKYKDIISNSTVVSTGRPAVIQLRPKKETFGTLTRLTVGERNVNKTNRTILLVGESGAGKSALINTLFNYSMGVKFEEEVWFQIVEDEKRSQTSDVTVYQIFESQTLPYSLTIIDTPGYADTRGLEHDINICQRLFDLFRSEDGVHEVHAVGLVMKATDNRLSDRLMYVFDSVMSLFGKDMEKNIVALITHSDGRKPKNALQALEAANVKCSRDQKDQPVYFLFDNCQHEDRAEDEEYLNGAAELSERGMTEFTDFLEKTEAQKLKKTVEVMTERVRLTACIQNLQDRIRLTELKQREITQTTDALKKHEEEMKENEKFTAEAEVQSKEKEPINGGKWGLVFYIGAVTCNVCKENCHYPGCTMAKSPKDCEVMKDGRCTSCRGKCPVSDHVKEKWKYVTKTKKVRRTEAQMKEKYEKNRRERERKKSLLGKLKEEMNRLTAEKSQLLDEAYQHFRRLEHFALKVDSVSLHVHLDFLIERMKERGDTEKLQRLEQRRSREDEATRAALRHMMASSSCGKTAKRQ
ncbi:immune-associated nucleotide-binding protein 12-like isoform X3 [Parambassis ranga]|uniref:Immune-associated nucleotide-binding protein 12-like isoform X3 n=1 Tax=Parambassis ranga TaxID=210632 RepID=A0A6P7JE54_9TELE|nr:immune-associated nucleotide-binding protein 12-like isoform X3 [Parambassis ranga]XP_028275132.1 immune-associated nucleotide-binding protein 12-like isoform X3 [Parambassis ranga]